VPEATVSLTDRVRAIQQNLEQRFIFRKLGICYDYACDPEEFPRRTLPSAKEAREGRPNAAGLGTGMADCARNGGLIFDGYLLRLELGIAQADEERIFDRLIGGLIRIATTAPKGYLVRGLTPDGRGFYSQSNLDAHLFWAFSVWRGVRTAAIAQESQGKMRNIASRWIARLKQDQFRIPPLEGKGAGVDLKSLTWESSPALLALLRVASIATGEAQWQEAYTALAAEADGARLSWTLPSPAPDTTQLLSLQIALHILAAEESDEARRESLRQTMRAVAEAATPSLDRFCECKDPILAETPDLDWRKVSAEDLRAPAEGASEAAMRLPIAWRRLRHEAETFRASLEAALIVLLAADRDLAEAHADRMLAGFTHAPWEALWLAGSLAPALSVHARGLEMGLWDAELAARTFVAPSMDNLVAPYLTPEFDDTHPQAAGHTDIPPRKRKKEEERQRALEQAKSAPANGEKDEKPRGRGRRRRRRRKR